MNVSFRKAVFFLVSVATIAGIVASPAFASSQTFTGTVGDAMCGAKHLMPGDAASCTRDCISMGSKYALLVGEKVYLLESTDQAVLVSLGKLAGEKVTVTGTEKSNTIKVSSVKAVQ